MPTTIRDHTNVNGYFYTLHYHPNVTPYDMKEYIDYLTTKFGVDTIGKTKTKKSSKSKTLEDLNIGNES